MIKTQSAAQRLQRLGRGDDTLLAHITAREAALLKSRGGSGTRNPKTGLLEFDTSGEGPGDAIGPATGGSAGSGEVADPSIPVAPALEGVTITGSAPTNSVSPGEADTFSFDMPQTVETGMAPIPAQSAPPSFMENLLKKGQTFVGNLALAKGAAMAASALGLPGAVLGMGISAAHAALSAPEGKGGQAAGQAIGNSVVNGMANQATGGMFGALGMNANIGPGMTGVDSSAASNGSGGGGFANNSSQSPTTTPQAYSPAIDYLRGGYGLYQANKLSQLAKGTSAEQAAQGQLTNLINDPSSITKTPGYEAGLQAVQRAAAGRGYLASGNLTVALSKYGTDFYNSSLSTLNTLANQNSAQRSQARTDSIRLAGQALNSLGYGYGRSNRPGGSAGDGSPLQMSAPNSSTEATPSADNWYDSSTPESNQVPAGDFWYE